MSRLAARRAAVQLVYEQMLGGSGGEDTLLGMIGFASDDAQDDVFIGQLIEGIRDKAAMLDEQIAKRSAKRELSRIPVVTRAILRVALYELMYLKDVPPAVIINEAVELAHLFAEETDSRFINGLLGNYLREAG